MLIWQESILLEMLLYTKYFILRNDFWTETRSPDQQKSNRSILEKNDLRLKNSGIPSWREKVLKIHYFQRIWIFTLCPLMHRFMLKRTLAIHVLVWLRKKEHSSIKEKKSFLNAFKLICCEWMALWSGLIILPAHSLKIKFWKYLCILHQFESSWLNEDQTYNLVNSPYADSGSISARRTKSQELHSFNTWHRKN